MRMYPNKCLSYVERIIHYNVALTSRRKYINLQFAKARISVMRYLRGIATQLTL